MADVAELVNELLHEEGQGVLKGNDIIPAESCLNSAVPPKEGIASSSAGLSPKNSVVDKIAPADITPTEITLAAELNSGIVSSPAKRKRGRPPKKAVNNSERKQPKRTVLENHSVHDSDSDDSTDYIPSTVTKIYQDPVNEKLDKENQEEVGEKKRSRPLRREAAIPRYYGDLIEFLDDDKPPKRTAEDQAYTYSNYVESVATEGKRRGRKPKAACTWNEEHFSVGIKVSAYFECPPNDPEAKMLPSAGDATRMLSMKLYDGEVAKHHERDGLYHIEWEDGDSEDYEVHELLQGVLKHQNRRLTVQPVVNSPSAFL